MQVYSPQKETTFYLLNQIKNVSCAKSQSIIKCTHSGLFAFCCHWTVKFNHTLEQLHSQHRCSNVVIDYVKTPCRQWISRASIVSLCWWLTDKLSYKLRQDYKTVHLQNEQKVRQTLWWFQHVVDMEQIATFYQVTGTFQETGTSPVNRKILCSTAD
jgi:hypothetical protein